MHYCLIVRIAGLEPLQQAMEDIATDLALQRLCKQLSTEIAGILDPATSSTLTLPWGSGVPVYIISPATAC